MWINGIKCFVGLMLIFSAVKEYGRAYSQIGHHSASLAAMVALLVIVGVLLIHSGSKRKKILSYFKKKSILAAVGLVLITIIIDYGYQHLFIKAPDGNAYLEHNFAIEFPTAPKVTQFKPQPEAGITGGYHFLSKTGHGGFMVIYADFLESITENNSDQEIIESSFETLPRFLKFTAANRIKTNIQGFLAYQFDVRHQDQIMGRGLACTVYSRLYYVVFIKDMAVVEDTVIDDFINSFKILNSDVYNKKV